jgi:hypothetical protein
VGGITVVVARRFISALYLTAVALVGAGCSGGEVRLSVVARCGSILELRLDSTREEITAALGEPLRHSKGVEPDHAGVAFDEILHYGSNGPDDPFLFWDQFDLLLLNNQLVEASAVRTFGDSRNAPSGVNPSIVFRLRRDTDGVERRDIGPVFDDVFGCQGADQR